MTDRHHTHGSLRIQDRSISYGSRGKRIETPERQTNSGSRQRYPLTWDILAHHFRVTLGRVPVNQLGWAVEHGYPEVPSKGPRHSTGQPYPPRRVAASQLAYSKPWRYAAEKDRPHIRLGVAHCAAHLPRWVNSLPTQSHSGHDLRPYWSDRARLPAHSRETDGEFFTAQGMQGKRSGRHARPSWGTRGKAPSQH